MNKSTIQTLIDKVIGKKGLIRVPSWWMRKVLMQMADWVQEGDDANSEKIVKVKEEADAKISTLETNTNEKIVKVKEEADGKIITLDNSTKAALIELKKSLHTQRCVVVKTGTSAGYVVVDGVTQEVPANTQKIVTYVDTFSFYNKSTKNQWLIFIGLAVADASSITDMAYMFSYCTGLTSLDLTGLNTSAVTSMNSMFFHCTGLTSLNLTGFNTSSVTNMGQMFSGCTRLTSLDLSSFDTSAVTNMMFMFSDCYLLASLNLSGLNTSAVTNMGSMFQKCEKLTSLDLSGLDATSVEKMGAMFSDCYLLASLNLSGFRTSAVTFMGKMFYRCNRLTSLDLSSFDTSAVTNMESMFYDCFSLTSLILGPNFFKTSKVTSISFNSSSKWTNDTVVISLVTNSYDRATAGLSTMTLQLSANTKAALTNEQKAAITAKGYTIA